MLLVPAENDSGLAFEAEDADRGCAEGEVFAEGSVVDPTAGKNAQDVGVSKEGDGTVCGEGTFDHGLGAGGDLFQGLSIGDVVLPNGPARNLFSNLRRGLALE